MRTSIILLLVSGLTLGCAGSKDPPHLSSNKDGAAPDAVRDLVPHHDIYSPLLDGGSDLLVIKQDSGCQLGTPNNCSFCSDVCAPGSDSATTQRVCINNKCDIQCKDEYYDVDASSSNGCEAQDDVPVHDIQSSAKDMGKLKDSGVAVTVTVSMPSDSRKHLKAPTDRLNGREDWFVAHIEDTTFGNLKGIAKLHLSSLPTGSSYKAEVWFECDNGKKPAKSSGTVSGGNDKSFTPSTKCNTTTIGDDSGKLYIRLVKSSGAHSAAQYKVEIIP
jgi:hypothetical protein